MAVKLSGIVRAHEEPALTAVVEISNATGDIVDQVQVDETGRYTYHLAPGTWSLRVWDAHGHRGEAKIELTNADDRALDIELQES